MTGTQNRGSNAVEAAGAATGDTAGREGLNVVVLLGGPSAEHDVSVVSGWAIADALAEAGLPVERIYIDLNGLWWSIPADAASGRPRPGSFDDPRTVDATGPQTPAQALDALAARNPRPVVFPALHGPF